MQGAVRGEEAHVPLQPAAPGEVVGVALDVGDAAAGLLQHDDAGAAAELATDDASFAAELPALRQARDNRLQVDWAAEALPTPAFTGRREVSLSVEAL